MTQKFKLSNEERIYAVKEYLEVKGSISKKYGIDEASLRMLVLRAQSEGIESIKISKTNKKYSKEIKLNEVLDILMKKEV